MFLSYFLHISFIFPPYFLYWSGGATPAHGMSAKRVERVALGRLVLRACVRPCVRSSHAKKRPKWPRNHWNSIRFFTKSEKLKILFNLHNSGLAKQQWNRWFGTRFGLEDAKKLFSSESQKKGQIDGFFVIFHFLRISFTKRFLFCFKSMINFHFWRQVRKVTKFWCKYLVHV